MVYVHVPVTSRCCLCRLTACVSVPAYLPLYPSACFWCVEHGELWCEQSGLQPQQHALWTGTSIACTSVRQIISIKTLQGENVCMHEQHTDATVFSVQPQQLSKALHSTLDERFSSSREQHLQGSRPQKHSKPYPNSHPNVLQHDASCCVKVQPRSKSVSRLLT